MVDTFRSIPLAALKNFTPPFTIEDWRKVVTEKLKEEELEALKKKYKELETKYEFLERDFQKAFNKLHQIHTLIHEVMGWYDPF